MYVVESEGRTMAGPEGSIFPILGLPATSVAFVVLQASVADCPLSIVAGLTDSVTSGFGGGAGAAGAGGGVVSTAGALTSFLWHPPNVRAKHPRTEEIIRLRLRMNILMPPGHGD